MQTRAKRGGQGAQRAKHARKVGHVQGEEGIFSPFLGALSLARVSLLAHVQPLARVSLLTLASCLPSVTGKTQINDACSAA